MSISAPTHYEISISSGSGYGASLTLTPNGGTVNSTTIYVRLIAGLSAATYNENITASSSNATDKTISCSGQVYNCLLYTSDAADDLLCVDLGGRRIIKKKKR